MNDLPMVSVIVPCFNNEKTIGRCIDSIINQTYSKMEIICIDDASQDSTRRILMGRKNNIRLLFNDNNKGPLLSRLEGVYCSKGDYIMFVDADDYIDNDYVEKLVCCIHISSSVVIGAALSHNCEGIITNYYKKQKRIERQEIWDDYYSQAGEDIIWFVIWGKLIPKSIMEENKEELESYCDIPIGEDIVSMISIYRKVNEVVFTGSSYYHYTTNNTGVTHRDMSYEEFSVAITGVKKVMFSLRSNVDSKSELQYAGYMKWKRKYLKIWNNKVMKSNIALHHKIKCIVALHLPFS